MDTGTNFLSETDSAMNRPLLSVQGLTVEFPRIGLPPLTALRDISLDIAPGEIVGLVGESGAGKTVLARTLLGLPPSPGRVAAGSVEYNGRDLSRMADRQMRELRGSEISMIVANPRAELNPLIPVGDQIATMLQVHRGLSRKAATSRALDMLNAVQIPDPGARARALPHELSGGMAQRVVIAMALICQPKFIVSDDATSGLDVTVQAQILDLLRELVRESGSSMLFITRDLAISAHFCDRVAVIFDGRIMEIAPREDFFLSPRHPTTIGLMTAFAHNDRLRKMWFRASDGAVATSSSCSYAARCPLAQDSCLAVSPPLVELSPGHSARCHFPVPR